MAIIDLAKEQQDSHIDPFNRKQTNKQTEPENKQQNDSHFFANSNIGGGSWLESTNFDGDTRRR